MLDFLIARLSDVCQMVEPLDRPETRVVVGNSYLFDLDEIRKDAMSARLHLDAWLIRQVAARFYKHRPKRACLVFLSFGNELGQREFVRLMVSERTGSLMASWLSDVHGFFELGREALPSNASLWASWDGKALSRIHDVFDSMPSGLMVADICGGIYIDQSEDSYAEFANDPIGRWDYTPIPRDGTEQIDIGGGHLVTLRHLAFQSIPPDVMLDVENDKELVDEDPATETAAARSSRAQEELPVHISDLVVRIRTRATRAAGIVEACQRHATACISVIEEALAQLTWAEVDPVCDALPQLAPEIVDSLISLLSSTRKQTVHVVTTALGRIKDRRSCSPLLEMMEHQAGTANAIRARDALIAIDDIAVVTLIDGLYSDGWETRMFAAQALGAIGSTESLDQLHEVSGSDRSTKVQAAALEAIATITDSKD